MLLRGWTLWDALNRSAARNLSSGNAAAFAQKRRKKRHFLRETRQICRDGSRRQLPFSASAERNDASFGKRDEYTAMVQGGRSPFPQAQKETTLPSRNASNLPRWFRATTAFLRKRRKKRRFLRETRRICRDDSCRQEPLPSQTQKETTLPSRNASNLPRWFRAATAFLCKRQGTALPSRNAAILFRTIIPARSSLPQVPKACASAALCGGAALPGRRRDEKFHISLLRERPA